MFGGVAGSLCVCVQLVQLKKQLEDEITLMTQNFGSLKVVHQRYMQSHEALGDLEKSAFVVLRALPCVFHPGSHHHTLHTSGSVEQGRF